jgi:hypothetical protein
MLLLLLLLLLQTMDAVRRRLAPIRGIPTKTGKMADPNADIKEVFDFFDELPKAPAKVFDNIKRWVSGRVLWGGMQCVEADGGWVVGKEKGEAQVGWCVRGAGWLVAG